MKKVFDQTVRDIRRGVNKKVLKVPSIEQKVLDATSNEPWGPHGTHLADIAQASRNYHEYQMIMSVIWKRINDTGKNWRHVYKALTVLEYLVANGSERVTDDIREHAFQISTLSTFQYIDSNGRDQGSNVRKKSQSLVALVNDKEQIQEVRQKASANKDKFRNTAGGMYRPGSGGYDDHRYGSRDEDRNGYGYRDDEYRGRSRSVDGDYGPRSRSSDREHERAYEDDGHNSSRGSNTKADDRSQEGSVGGGHLERKFSEQNLGAPPSYEDAVGEDHNERNGETATTLGSKSSSPNVTTNHQETTVSSNPAAPPSPAAAPTPAAAKLAANSNKENDGFDLFDPRGPSTAAPPASGGAEMDLLGSLSDSFSSNALALVPSTSATSVADAPTNSNPGQTFVAPSSAPAVSSQPFDDPFGDGPFRAVPSTDGFSGQPQSTSVQPQSTSGSGNNFGFGETFNDNTDILADILPPPGPTVPAQTTFQAQPGQLSTPTGFPTQAAQPGYVAQFGQPMPPQPGFPPQQGGPFTPQPGFPPHQGGQFTPQPGFTAQQGGQSTSQPGFPHQQGGQFAPQPGFPPHQGGQFTPQPDFTAQQGGQSTSQRGFPPQQGGQFTPQLSFPPQQGGQSTPQPGFPPQQGGQCTSQPGFPARQGGQSTPQPGFPAQQGGQSMSHPGFLPHQGGQPTPQPGFPPHQNGQSTSQPGFPAQMGPVSQVGFPNSNGQPAQPSNFYGGFQSQGSLAPVTPPAAQYNTSNFYQQPPLTASTGALAIVPQQPAKEKFETKSTVWADTLNRGLVNLNISGSKTNPLSDIGIDFEAINRKEKRMEKPSKTPVTSNVSMGKAMGSGSGIGRAGAGALRAAPTPMVGSGMAMGAPGAGPGYGAGYAGVNQPIGMNHMGQNMGMGMNMGQMQQPPAGFQPGPAMPGIYNPMMGRGGGYGPQPYGGYR